MVVTDKQTDLQTESDAYGSIILHCTDGRFKKEDILGTVYKVQRRWKNWTSCKGGGGLEANSHLLL